MSDSTASSETHPAQDDAPRSARLALWSLLLGNLAIGTGFMLPIGLLHLIASSTSVTVSRAGTLMWAGGIVVAIGAPLMAWITGRFERRNLLVGALLLYAVGHGLSAMASSFSLLLALRLVTLLGAAIFTAQAAASVSLLVPHERRASSIAFIFTGWSVAAAAAVPLTTWVGAEAGWPASFWMVSVLALASLALVGFSVPAGLRVARVSFTTWIAVARDPVLPLILAVSVLLMAGGFTFYTFLAPEIERRLHPSSTLIAALLACFGIAGVAGNIAASRLVKRIPPSHLVLLGIGLAAAGLLCLDLAPPRVAFYFAALTIWGVGAFGVQSLQQARLFAARPLLAPATAALSTSANYVGQALGGILGSFMIALGNADDLAWVGAVILIASMAVSVLADRSARFGE